LPGGRNRDLCDLGIAGAMIINVVRCVFQMFFGGKGLLCFPGVKFQRVFVLGKLEIYGTTVSAVWYRN